MNFPDCIPPLLGYDGNMSMMLIRFPDEAAKRKARGHLMGRFSFKTWATGEWIVPDCAIRSLALEGIPFNVEGPATYEQLVPAIPNSASTES